ncbi:MAG: rane dipeptidase [Chloroflexota bacterium]|jgi:membrane dipeptidase|nr:rane dipeptidase [Chloroflexota bacterium]
MRATDIATISIDKDEERHAVELHRRSIVVDCGSVVKQEPAHFERAKQGGVTATNHTVTHPNSDAATALKDIASCRQWIARNPTEVVLATTTEDIREAKATNREGVILGPQNTDFLGPDLSLLGEFAELGVRILQLTYQKQNWVGSGCGEARDSGLSAFGHQLVSAMDDRGIVVDLSHCGPVTGADAIKASRNPVIFSHAHPARIAPHIRAKSDDLLKALAAKGGVIGITALSMFLYDPAHPKERPGLPAFVRHIQYLIDLIGIDHVGIGLDFDETNTEEKWDAWRREVPELDTGWSFGERRIRDLTNAADEVNITRALVGAGLSDGDIQKILGLNFLRVFDQVWKS